MTQVIKATGEKEAFNEDKIIYSIKRAGIPANLQDKVLSHVKNNLYENIPTSEIYRHITEFLNTQEKIHPVKYSLKQAIMKLGPTGYPFEDYISQLLKLEGYETEVRSTLFGKCVSHEIDVIAKKGSSKYMVEAKFHNTTGTRTDVHVALYTKARFDDVKEKFKFDKAYLFTNTKITSDALAYAICVDMGVVGWSYPENESLRDLIEKYKLYPISLIPSLSENELEILLNSHVVLVEQILKNHNVLDILGVQSEKKRKILEEANLI